MGAGDPRDILIGGVLQCTEAFTLGMPFEVWKTQQISGLAKGQWNSFIVEFKTLCESGWGRFYHGTGAKMVEAALKGSILLFGTNLTLELEPMLGVNPHGAMGGMLAGFVGGVMQTVVMSPMTYVVTYKNRNPQYHSMSLFTVLRKAGFRKAYGSAPAMAGRQGTNWALRWFFAVAFTNKYKELVGRQKLTTPEEIFCGIMGGVLGCINQPFEVVRVLQQARQATGEQGVTTRNCVSYVYKTYGLKGFYAGIIPRMGLSAWQTLFMVTFAGMIKERLQAISHKVELIKS
ncbi:mitochondrial carrier protein, putative [Trypanosoma cruzi]|uniref:Mitochondrial carrier protein n=2 Tax=Trypanosoma cruzi TaxID=5693 RepID=V5BE12_TRYCR|nr:mitochondrial carrier protein, putative [Trypanosoma cruzi]ESS64277.1 mitochondrial carrier protein [Trypanosoma cruzi Dm28c]PBJ69287.1 mitochondrial carrier protein [Trypanosoma cruzi cruzi]KAF8283701.1 putative mitochondrial carrier protein [Trypanosoma cruzi]PBJ69320.1 mitochondrial carrier protein [Trypanosoma cruzi cruzi]